MSETKLEQTQEALRQCKEQFQLFSEGVENAAICMLSPQGYVLSWNPGAERIEGYKTDEIIGKHFSCFFAPQAIALGRPQRQLQAAFEQGSTEDEGWRVRDDGRPFWAHVVTTALFDKQGALRGFAEVTRDLTERRGAERSLSDKNLELQNALEAKSQFLANMSHELRTPLNHILGFTELLVDDKLGTLNPKQTGYLETILDSGNHLLELINDVLELAKVKAGKIKLNPERFSLRKAIEEVCGMLKPIAGKKSIQMDLDVAPELGEITLDQPKFKQALYNLLSNAVKFTDDGGRVEILAAPYDEHRFKLAVRDTGIGIKSEDLPRLFRPFEQLEAGTTRRYEGMGLGLALTQQIVELQGGSIGVESEAGRGSRFTVVLPLVVAEGNG
jgi:PAS domain S-box-containing protein